MLSIRTSMLDSPIAVPFAEESPSRKERGKAHHRSAIFMSMHRPSRMIPWTFVIALFVAACGGGGGGGGGGGAGSGTADLMLARAVEGLSFPLDFAGPPGDSTRWFVAEKGGRIRVVRDGSLQPLPFLDLSALVSGGAEQGLLGLVFHPSYPADPRFFVNYTDLAGDTHIVSYRVSSDPDLADPTSAVQILFVDQPFANHNGGGLAFGGDGFFYVALGDGGSGGDPQGNGQSLSTLLGKILRLDVDAANPIPPGNPFVGTTGARGEIWSLGLRNPFRFSFDRETGDQYIGDVGQSTREEIDFEPGSSSGGLNFGWNRTEGSLCFGSSDCDRSGITFPISEYPTDTGCSVIGGYVYRGSMIPAIRGHYFYGDFCAGFVRSLRVSGGRAVDEREYPDLNSGDQITSFGQDAAGEIYILTSGGTVFRIAAKP
jgi:glucose/arabinose dehydrogenase